MRAGGVHSPEGLTQQELAERIKQVELGKMRPDTARSLELKLKAEKSQAEQDENGLTRDELKKLLDRTFEVVDMLAPRRHLEYEVVEDADMVQVHVVNTDDGSIVRKIPSDEIVDLVKQIRQMLSDRFEVEA